MHARRFYAGFQFLNGSIKSKLARNGERAAFLFQFLNGSIKRRGNAKVGQLGSDFNS